MICLSHKLEFPYLHESQCRVWNIGEFHFQWLLKGTKTVDGHIVANFPFIRVPRPSFPWEHDLFLPKCLHHSVCSEAWQHWGCATRNGGKQQRLNIFWLLLHRLEVEIHEGQVQPPPNNILVHTGKVKDKAFGQGKNAQQRMGKGGKCSWKQLLPCSLGLEFLPHWRTGWCWTLAGAWESDPLEQEFKK